MSIILINLDHDDCSPYIAITIICHDSLRSQFVSCNYNLLRVRIIIVYTLRSPSSDSDYICPRVLKLRGAQKLYPCILKSAKNRNGSPTIAILSHRGESSVAVLSLHMNYWCSGSYWTQISRYKRDEYSERERKNWVLSYVGICTVRPTVWAHALGWADTYTFSTIIGLVAFFCTCMEIGYRSSHYVVKYWNTRKKTWENSIPKGKEDSRGSFRYVAQLLPWEQSRKTEGNDISWTLHYMHSSTKMNMRHSWNPFPSTPGIFSQLFETPCFVISMKICILEKRGEREFLARTNGKWIFVPFLF